MKSTCKHCGFQWEKGTDSNHSKDNCIERLKAESDSHKKVALQYWTELLEAKEVINDLVNVITQKDVKIEDLTTEQGE